MFKDKFLSPNDLGYTDKCTESAKHSPVMRGHSPLANLIISEHLTKIDGYLQESLNLCSESQENKTISTLITSEVETPKATQEINKTKYDDIGMSNQQNYDNSFDSYHKNEDGHYDETRERDGKSETKSNLYSVQTKHPGVLSAIYNMPMHYHAAVLCFLLIVYNFVYQYIKQNCHGKNQSIS
uniref:Uncharacterized protein n=1 Tax=Pararge aegeria TaxID=116150 RepID=S4P882_9NEOP